MEDFKKLRCRKELGVWYYTVEKASTYNDLDADVYTLYDANKKFVSNFAYYNDMKYYIETGVII